MAKRDRKANAPKGAGGAAIQPPKPTDHNKTTPKFCLAHVLPDYSLDHLDMEQRASVAVAIQMRCKMTWQQLLLADKHGLGSEMLPHDQLRCRLPEAFKDEAKVMVFRYHGKLPMVGVRVADTYHVLCFERQYGELYDHG